MNKISNVIEQNSLNIKVSYAQILASYLIKTKPDSANTIKSLIVRLRNAKESPVSIAKYTADNVVDSLIQILDSLQTEFPSTSGAPMPPILSPFSSSDTVVAEEQEIEMIDLDNSSDVENGDEYDEDAINRDMNEIKILTTSLLESNSLQSLTRQSLFEFERLVGDSALIYEDYFRNGIELSAIDCDLNDNLQRFMTIFKRYGPVRCVVADVEYYAERVRNNPAMVSSLPPSVRAAVVTILDLVERKQAYTLDININPREFNEIKDATVKSLLNCYSDYRPIKFNVVAESGGGGATVTAPGTRRPVEPMSTDEEDIQMTQTMRRKRKMRAAIFNSAKSKKTSDQSTPTTTPAAAAAAAGTVSDEAFIDNVRQMHQSNAIVPKLIKQIVAVIPSDVASSMLTCPTNGLGDVKISAQNYNTTISLINKINLTAINENVYFYKLLEPLAYYGSSEELVTKVLWFIARAANYFTNSARNFNYLRGTLRTLTDDVDRVALFMIRYNFLWFYRQFLDQLLSASTTPYQNQKIINVLHVYASVVQKEYSKIQYDFNQSRVYVGPVDNAVKLMVVATSDILA
ncbi:P87 [Spodoptera eridania nucleopolyhedrovirus]|uniref:P87 n=1 Tax=Spodoptera eridania nucleopolyhedrovirus TaxID=2315721 RepID=A0A346TQ01_9ABAC|nr:P87 [Spodoptera eridania nucleopolyhedrovirus]AXU41661.1 P87 [Spodoptera eridania nucleopolyhedrovirus]